MNQTLSTQRKLGTLLSYAMLLCNTIINLAYVPILLTFIGISEFGLYRLLGSIIAYFNILNFFVIVYIYIFFYFLFIFFISLILFFFFFSVLMLNFFCFINLS